LWGDDLTTYNGVHGVLLSTNRTCFTCAPASATLLNDVLAASRAQAVAL
jgi:hypothetical protein